MTQPTYKPSVAEYRSDHALTATRTQSDPDNQEILTTSSVPFYHWILWTADE